jgi:hypothetical protein
MPKTTKKMMSKKTKRAPKPDALEQAKADFDAAGIECMLACLGFVTSPTLAISARSMVAQEAGLALQDAYAAVLRARDAAPIPMRPTAKAERAGLASRPMPRSTKRRWPQ